MTPKEKYKIFWFEKWDYRLDTERHCLLIELNYSLDKQISFRETLQLPVQWKIIPKHSLKALEKAIEALHLAGGISYYKTYLPREMAGVDLDENQARFWREVYEKGLGEFFYRNKIDFRGLINFPALKKESEPPPGDSPLEEDCLLPLGGGKDSIVSAEILKQAGIDFTLISLRDADPIANTAHAIGKPRLVIDRQLDAELFRLNDQGAYNGHVPITAYISFLLVLCGIVYGKKYLVMSLEKSANFGQLLFHGLDVNHQYSKSEEFEGNFRRYIASYVHSGIEYFSLLRGYHELKIASIFCQLQNFDRYANIFTSCNSNFRIIRERARTLWCCNCPKCLFVFIILAPFLEKKKLLTIFGENLLERHDLLPLLEELLGQRNFKPFECVGTVEESQLALLLISQKADYQNDLLVRYFTDKILPHLGRTDWQNEKDKLLSMSDKNFIPLKFREILHNYD